MTDGYFGALLPEGYGAGELPGEPAGGECLCRAACRIVPVPTAGAAT